MADKLRFNDNAIKELFHQYVESFEDQERHSAEAVRYAEAFDNFISRNISGNALTKIEAYTKMTDVAVEFEEGGFIAGFKAAMGILLSGEDVTQQETEAEKAQEQDLGRQTTNSTLKAEKSQHESLTGSQQPTKADGCFITSVQIAEMFNQTNYKVCNRIEKRVLPFLDGQSKALFRKESGKNPRGREITYYRLNQAACKMYLDAVEPKKTQFINIAGGYAKLQELMQRTFPTEAVALPA